MSGQPIAAVVDRRMSKDTVLETLRRVGISVVQQDRNGTDNAWRIRADIGANCACVQCRQYSCSGQEFMGDRAAHWRLRPWPICRIDCNPHFGGATGA